MMKRTLAVLLCLCIAFLPAIGHAGARTTVPGFYKTIEPPVPKPKLPNGKAAAQPALDLTVVPKSKPKTALPLAAAAVQPALDLTVVQKNQLPPVFKETAATKNELPPFPKGGQGGFCKTTSSPSISSAATAERSVTVASKSKSKSASPATTSSVPPALDPTAASKSKPKKTASPLTTSSSSTVPANQLPEDPTLVYGNATVGKAQLNKNGIETLDITQNTSKAILDWGSFNIGAKAEVDFYQKNSSWVCLNRIFDRNASQILGTLNATGQVYLINQNGILFGKNSQVNVHTMIASSLDITNNNFENGVLAFQAEDYQGAGTDSYLNSSVINQGAITTDAFGAVFLLSPNVENDEAITTQAGQIGLAAGDTVSLLNTNSTSSRVALAVVVEQTAGDAVNKGQMLANTGLIGMYGENVDQYGTVEAVEALKTSGQIELMAADSVTTGAGSVTATPVSGSTDSADQSFGYNGGTITIMGLGLPPGFSTTDTAVALARQIVNNGLIQAPAGAINMNAQNRVYLASGSSIDVSGLWIDKPASANTTQIQLNGVELRDFPDQKNGFLRGKTITVSNLLGSSIGDISGSLTAQSETAQERSLKGGTINISLPYTGNMIEKQGASIDFSGGGTNYSAGTVTTTGLISGNKVYSIGNAPETLTYTGITNVSQYVGSYQEGAHAGILSLLAGTVVLDGNIQGKATVGVYQTSKSELVDRMGEKKTLGVAIPAGGTMYIGGLFDPQSSIMDYVTGPVVIQEQVAPLPSGFGPESQLNDSVSYLSALKLSSAGLSNLQITSNTTITVTPDADFSMNAGSTLSLAARRIDFEGSINIPSGNVSLIVADNITAFSSLDRVNANPRYDTDVVSEIILGQGSQINVAGQEADNSIAANGAGATTPFTYIAGGSVSILDESYYSQGVVAAGLIDVSGGYGISQKGAVTGGNAGSLSIQGVGIVLDGKLRAYSITGNTGGTITLNAESIEVAQSTPSNSGGTLGSGLILGQNELADAGFTQIALQSLENTTIDSGANLAVSTLKFPTPLPGADNNANAIPVPQYMVTGSSVKITAESTFQMPPTSLQASDLPYPFSNLPDTGATISIPNGAGVTVAPGGSITMSAPYIDIGGVLTAPAGTVNITAGYNLDLEGSILAKGYPEPALQPLFAGLPAGYTPNPLAGGSVTLTASAVTTGANSLVDVSGSTPVTAYILNSTGGFVAQTVSSNPGSVAISSYYGPSLSGVLDGRSEMAGIQGGTLSISCGSSGGAYTISASDFNNYRGFDAMTFTAGSALNFSGDMNISVGRSLTFNAPLITGSGNITFSAPSILLENTALGAPAPSGGSASLSLVATAGSIDVTGSISLSGFQSVNLSAAHDITLSDFVNGTNWEGQMLTSANTLTLQAERIYPTTLSSFTIDDSGGTVKVEGNGYNSLPIYSAGGSLTIDAHDIEVLGGYLAAPMGQIILSADTTSGSVTLSSGSIVSTAGFGSVEVDYGSLNERILDKNG